MILSMYGQMPTHFYLWSPARSPHQVSRKSAVHWTSKEFRVSSTFDRWCLMGEDRNASLNGYSRSVWCALGAETIMFELPFLVGQITVGTSMSSHLFYMRLVLD